MEINYPQESVNRIYIFEGDNEPDQREVMLVVGIPLLEYNFYRTFTIYVYPHMCIALNNLHITFLSP